MAGANLDDKMFDRQIAIINSMTKKERANPDLLNAKRASRIAKGSGTKVEDVNKLMKQHRQMADMMKAVGAARAARWPASPAMFGGRNADARQSGDQGKERPRASTRPGLPRRRGSPKLPKQLTQNKLPTDVGQLLRESSGSRHPGAAARRSRPSRPPRAASCLKKRAHLLTTDHTKD